MLIRRINGCTEVIGEEQGYAALPIRKVTKPTIISGKVYQTTHIETAWEPTPKELALLNQGHSVILSMLNWGTPVPPQNIYVEPALPESDDTGVKAQLQACEDAIASLERLLIPVSGYFNSPVEGNPKDTESEFHAAVHVHDFLVDTIQELMEMADGLRGSVIT